MMMMMMMMMMVLMMVMVVVVVMMMMMMMMKTTTTNYSLHQSNLTTPVQPKGTFDEVATQLTEGIEPDVCRVRALTTWLAGQKVRTRPYGADAKPGTVLGYMKQIKENKGTFPGLLAHLCR